MKLFELSDWVWSFFLELIFDLVAMGCDPVTAVKCLFTSPVLFVIGELLLLFKLVKLLAAVLELFACWFDLLFGCCPVELINWFDMLLGWHHFQPHHLYKYQSYIIFALLLWLLLLFYIYIYIVYILRIKIQNNLNKI